ncbi:unnamed protein product [Gongylonema pulchrum]|uniref:Uncharacterized protein n=1 Tax=Gongylonema pulchrum TaxID=637853 RepID=A0A183ER47_9BILA|nr:unnamed protein product [Gongylonema pulchrum]
METFYENSVITGEVQAILHGDVICYCHPIFPSVEESRLRRGSKAVFVQKNGSVEAEDERDALGYGPSLIGIS